MGQSITASVGAGGVNRPDDVRVVEQLLHARGFTGIGEPDEVCDGATLAAIRAYQEGYMSAPDGRIDPGGRGWRLLSAVYSGSSDAPTPDSDLLRPVPRPAPGSINTGLKAVSNDYMLQRFGSPLLGGGYTEHCQTPTHPQLRRNIVLDTVGPFRVTGLVPAVLSLKAVMADIQAEQPAVYAVLGTAGMLCCRLVRGSTTSISNHSWGTAIDLTLDGRLDVWGDDKVQFGLTLIAPIFNRHGWFWGAAFGKEDGMHFEGSRALVDQWSTQLR